MSYTEKLREQFEAWARKNELEAERHKYADDQYDDHAATSAWWAWRDAFQVGRAAAPADHFCGVTKMVIDRVIAETNARNHPDWRSYVRDIIETADKLRSPDNAD